MEGLIFCVIVMFAGWTTFSTLLKCISYAKHYWYIKNYVGMIFSIVLIPLTPMLFVAIVVLGLTAMEIPYLL